MYLSFRLGLAILFIGVGSSKASQIGAQTVISSRGFPALQITNKSSNAVTAYAFTTIDSLTRDDGTSYTVRSERLKDAIRNRQASIIPPGRTDIVMEAADASTQFMFEAAIFEDGTIVGDEKAARSLVNARRVTLQALNKIISDLIVAIRQEQTPADLTTVLKKSEEVAQKKLGTGLLKDELSAEYKATIGNLDRASNYTPDGVRHSREQLLARWRERRDELLASKPVLNPE